MVLGCGKQGHKIKSEDLPTDHQIVRVKRRNMIWVVDINEEENEYDHANNEDEQENLEKKRIK